MMRNRFLPMILLALLPALAAAASDAPGLYAATAPLTLAPGEGLQTLALPWPVLQASRSTGLSDVRIFDAKGLAVPTAWAPAPAVSDSSRQQPLPRFAWPEAPPAETAMPSMQLKLSTTGAVLSVNGSAQSRTAGRKGEAQIWLLDLSALSALQDDGERLSRIQLDWPRREAGLSTTVDVEASADGQQWQWITRSQLLDFDASSPDAPRLKSVAWPAGAAKPRYVRLRFGIPLALTLSEAQWTRAGSAPPLPQQTGLSFEPLSGQAGEWRLDLQGPVAPESLALNLPEPNTLLSLRLEQRNKEGEAWRPVTRFAAWRMKTGGRESSSEALPLGHAAPARYWRLRAEGSAQGLESKPLGVSISWRPPRLVFLARGESQAGFILAVGREGAPSVALPLAGLIPAYQDGAEQALPQASIGALSPQAQAPWQEQVKNANPEDQRRWILWAVLVLAVAGLGTLAWRMLKQITPPK